jgi:hypothetical protein
MPYHTSKFKITSGKLYKTKMPITPSVPNSKGILERIGNPIPADSMLMSLGNDQIGDAFHILYFFHDNCKILIHVYESEFGKWFEEN